MSEPYDFNAYHGMLERVIDGDTVRILVDLGLRVMTSVNVRIADINAPETVGTERDAGLLSKTALEQIFQTHQGVFVVTFQKGKSFDRWIGHITLTAPDGAEHDVGTLMVEGGHAQWWRP